MEEKIYQGKTRKTGSVFLKASLVMLLMILSFQHAKAQQTLRLEWDYTYTSGLGCKYPMLVTIYYSLSDGSNYQFTIFQHPSYTGSETYPNYSSQKFYSIYLPAGVTISPIRIAAGYINNEGKCPSLPSNRLCYSGGVFDISHSTTDYCAWNQTAPAICGLSGFKVTANVSPNSGTPITQLSTVKPTYCPGEAITFEVPCNFKGRGWTYNWYYREGTGSFKLLKTSTSETLVVGEGYDLAPKAGVNTYLRVTGKYGLSSEVSGSFRYGAHAPTATIDPKPPQCADGDDWYININGASSSDAVITTFKANIFHSSNTSAIPDGYVSFSGSTGQLKKSNIVSSRVFAPGTSFRMTIQNDHDPTVYGACETAIGGTYTIPNKPKMTATENTAGHKNLTCYNVLTGQLQVNVSNGDGNYTVRLNNVVYPVKTGSPTHAPIIENLDGGTYSVKVNDTNCEADAVTVVLTEPGQLTASVEVIKGLDCSDSNDGELKVNIGGGISPYTVNWSNGSTAITATGFAEGTHTVTVKDQGCPAITRTQALDAPEPMVITLTGISPKCPGGDDGSMRVSSLQNAPGTIEYSWSNGGTSSEILGITKGTYSVTVTSRNAGKTCQGIASKVLDDPAPWTATIQPLLAHNGSAISCNGEDDGRLDVIVKNDLGQVVDGEYYTWSTGENGASKKFIDQLTEGTYEITVRYSGVCEAKSSYTLFDPDPVTASILPNSNYNGQLISCNNETDASIRATATGGTGIPAAFSYTWHTGETDPVLSGIGAGTYGVTVSDLNGCPGTATYTIDNPEAVTALILSPSDYSGYGVSCAGKNDGYITAGGSGGTNVFTYAWSTGAGTAFIEALGTGDYTVTVSDNNGCSATASHTITAPDALTLTVSGKQNISCFNGSDGFIALQAGGGVEQYEFSRDNATWQSSPLFSALKVGTFQLYVRDANSCANTLTESLSQPTAIGISFTDIEPAYCANPVGKATAVVTGGVGDYQYEWRPDGGTEILSTTSALSDVPAGIYDLFVRDGNNCLMDNAVPITSTDGAKTTYSTVDTKCFDSSDGSAQITITEGDGPFIILWPDGQHTLEAVNLKRGTYNVLVTDGHDCTVIQPVEVNAPDALQLNVKSETIPTCHTFCDGELTLEAVGGVGGYTYDWNNKTGATQTQLCAAVYPVIVRDANGCFLAKDVELKQPEPLAVNVVKETLPTCKDGCDGALEITATGGNGGYQYAWASGGNTPVKNNLCPASYDVTITDLKGCTHEGIVKLNNTPPLPLDLGGGVTLCVGQTYTLNAGSGWISTSWSGSNGLSSTAQQVVIKDPGQYWLEVFNSEGCVAYDTFLLETSVDLLKANFILTSEAYVGDTVVMIDVSWPLPENIQWTYPSGMVNLLDAGDIVYGQFSDPGTYQVSLTVNLGECRDQMTKTIAILTGEKEAEGGRLGYEDFVQEFTLYPNPNDGSFDVGIELLEESPIVISVWSTVPSRLMGKVHANGSRSYIKHVDLRPLSSGTYVLRLDHAKGREYIRFVVY